MEKENSVLFVHGFSFRDEHLRDVVLRAARANPTLQVIVFCYSRADRAEYQKLIPDIDVKNSNILFVAPAAPDEGDDRDQGDSRRRRRATTSLRSSPTSSLQPDQRIELGIRISPSESARCLRGTRSSRTTSFG